MPLGYPLSQRYPLSLVYPLSLGYPLSLVYPLSQRFHFNCATTLKVPKLHGHLFPPSLLELAARAMEEHNQISSPATAAVVPPWIAEYLGCVKSCSWCHTPLFGEYAEYVSTGMVANCHRAPMHFVACGKSHVGFQTGGEGFNFYMAQAQARSTLEAQASAAAIASAEYEAQRDHRTWMQTR
jgi:hypothetical protein